MIIKAKQSGFTLIEALVSVAIFAVVVAMASVLFLATSNAQRKATNQEKVMRETRQTMEAIARLTRMSVVNYEEYGASGVDGAQNELNLIHNTENIKFSLNEEKHRVMYENNGASDFFTGQDIDITNLQFFISDEDEPWPTQVTILLTAERAGEHGSADVLQTQTTIVTRHYE